MLKHVNVNYANITKDSVELFKSYCQVCQEKKERQKRKALWSNQSLPENSTPVVR
ncbi:hypothetical protein DPMN_159590 [Dreissena polymorpha]|uniref:Uncharacterized protein n=1 Tax=Dreissena polymorpha TaxID=45954 RepID=A0A9D4EL77_DREPO|nr:hypothetical protein DPMN_159590 [Dreissena polymorpha]